NAQIASRSVSSESRCVQSAARSDAPRDAPSSDASPPLDDEVGMATTRRGLQLALDNLRCNSRTGARRDAPQVGYEERVVHGRERAQQADLLAAGNACLSPRRWGRVSSRARLGRWRWRRSPP